MPIVRIFFIVYLQQSMACLILILSCQSIVFPSYSAQTFFYASTYKRVRLMEKEARSLVVVPRMASPLSATYRHNTINSSYGGAKASSPQPFSIRMDHLTPPLLLILLVVAAVFFPDDDDDQHGGDDDVAPAVAYSAPFSESESRARLPLLQNVTIERAERQMQGTRSRKNKNKLSRRSCGSEISHPQAESATTIRKQ